MNLTCTENPAPDAVTMGETLDRRLLQGYLHKTSNSLCGIKGYASLIASPPSGQARVAHWARIIIAEIERMEEIFRSVGDLTGPRQHPDVGVDLPSLLENVFDVCEAKCSGLEVVFHGELPRGDLLLPRADLCLVLTELFCNANEGRTGVATPVRVDVTSEVLSHGRVSLRLQDNGEGIAVELLDQATAPFLTTKDNHAGIGLTRVETLMEMYGLAWSLSSTPGRGTVATIEVATTHVQSENLLCDRV